MNNPPELPLSGGMSITLLGSIPCSGFKRTHPKQKKKEQGQTPHQEMMSHLSCPWAFTGIMVATYSAWVKVQTQARKTFPNLPDHAPLICNYNNDWTNQLDLMWRGNDGVITSEEQAEER